MSQDFEMVVPYVVVTSRGGPYEGEAFAAGVAYGQARSAVPPQGRFRWAGYVPPGLIPQLDLLAMEVDAEMLTHVDPDQQELVLVVLERGD